VKKLIPVIVFVLVFFASCKKEDTQNTSQPQNPSTSTENKLKDSVLLYSKDIYLWYNQIPASFNAQNYADPDKIMTAIRAYSMETGFSQPVDKWSFAYKQQDWDNLSSGVSQDFGLNIFFKAEGDLRVKSVEKNSPAGIAGIHRGWQITSINGNTNLTTSNANFIVSAVYESTSGSFTFKKPDGNSVNINLSAATYQEHPVYLDSIYTVGSEKVGYMVFNSFLGDTLEVYNEFQRVFNGFTRQNVGDVVIDLRYNGGGYVSVQEKLANWLVNSSANNQVMMNQQFNDKYTEYNETTPFTKIGSLNLSRIFFIVSNSTASASELLINNLKPYMDVKLIGPSNTYGKPVGFFPIPVGDWYIFPVSFRSTNKSGEGNYFNGLPVAKQVADGLDKDWGDINESSLSNVLGYINTGAFKSIAVGQPTVGYKPDPQVSSANTTLDQSSFKGAVEKRKAL